MRISKCKGIKKSDTDKCVFGRWQPTEGELEKKSKRKKSKRTKAKDKKVYYRLGDKSIKQDYKKARDAIYGGRLKPEFSTNDKFVKYTDEIKDSIKQGDPQYPKIGFSPKAFSIKLNLNKEAKILATYKVTGESGKTVNYVLRNPVFTMYRDYIKHQRVDKLVNGNLTKALDTFKVVMNNTRKTEEQQDVAALLYLAGTSAQRIGSAVGTKASVHEFVETGEFKKNGQPKLKKKFKGWVETFALCTLQGKHVKVKGETVTFDYMGKCGIRQTHAIKDKDLAEYYSRKLEVTAKDEPLHSNRIYSKVTKHYKEATKGKSTIKDLRTAMVHTKFTDVYAQWKKKYGIPESKKEKKDCLVYICTEISKILGNTPNEVKKSYASPHMINKLLETGEVE